MVLGDRVCHFTQRTLRNECKMSDSNVLDPQSVSWLRISPGESILLS